MEQDQNIKRFKNSHETRVPKAENLRKTSFKRGQNKGKKPQQHSVKAPKAHHSKNNNNENNGTKRPHKPVKRRNKPTGTSENTPKE